MVYHVRMFQGGVFQGVSASCRIGGGGVRMDFSCFSHVSEGAAIMNFYKHYIGDYQRDTGHLSLTEHGAYRLMLDAFYATGKPLPAEKRALYRLVRAESRQDRLAVDSVAAQFWQAANGGLVNRRACVEIARAEKQAEVNRQIALAREERRRLQRQLAPGGSAAGGNGGLAGCQEDHACAEVSEVCKVNDTQVIYGLQPFMVTNRATSGCTQGGTAVVTSACVSGETDGSSGRKQNHDRNRGIGDGAGAVDGAVCRRAGTNAVDGGACRAAVGRVSAGNAPVSPAGDDGNAGVVVGNACAGIAGGAVDGAGLQVVCDGVSGGGAAGDDGGNGVSAGVLVGVLRRYGVAASVSDPRVRTMVAQGVDTALLASACMEARRVRPDERIGVAYVARIVARWLQDGVTGFDAAGRAGGRFGAARSCAADERREVLDVLTGRHTLEGVVSPVSADAVTGAVADGVDDGV